MPAGSKGRRPTDSVATIGFVDSFCPSVNTTCVGGTVGLMDADGSHVRLLKVSGRAPVFSPDGSRLVFEREGSDCPNGCQELLVTKVSGARPTSLSRDGRNASWSPDGSLIAFERDISPCADRSTCSNVWVVRPDGSGLRLLIRDASTPAWSPDGTRIAFVRGHQTAVTCTSDLWTARPDGSSPRQVTFAGAQVLHAAWSPDGSRFAVARRDSSVCARGDRSEYGLYIVSSGGSAPRKIAERASRVSWSPHGDEIVFERLNCTATVCPPADAMVVRPDGRGLHQLRNWTSWPSFATRSQ